MAETRYITTRMLLVTMVVLYSMTIVASLLLIMAVSLSIVTLATSINRAVVPRSITAAATWLLMMVKTQRMLVTLLLMAMALMLISMAVMSCRTAIKMSMVMMPSIAVPAALPTMEAETQCILGVTLMVMMVAPCSIKGAETLLLTTELTLYIVMT